MFEDYLAQFQSLETPSEPENELEFEAKTPEQFWGLATQLRFIGAPASLMRFQWNVSQNDAWRPAGVPPLSFLGAASQREVQNYLYPGSYQPQDRLNRGERRSTRRGSGPGPGNIFREREHWDEVGVVPFENGLGSVCGFTFFEGNCFLPDDLVHKRVRGRGSEGGLAMLVSTQRKTVKAFHGTVFIMRHLVAALRAQLRWSRDLPIPLPLVVFRHDDQQQTRTAWSQLPPSRRILITDEVGAADIYQARLANARIVACSKLISKLAEHGNITWVLRKAVELARPWKSVLRQMLSTMPRVEAQALFAKMEWDAAERALFLERSDDSLRRRISGWFPDALVPRTNIGGRTIIQRTNGWFDEDMGAKISPVVRVARILRSSFGRGIVEGDAVTDGEPHEFRVPLGRVEQRGLLWAVSRDFRARGISFDHRKRWSDHSLEIASRFSEPQTIERADVVGCTGHDFRFPNFGITYSGFQPEEATPLPCRDRPCERLQLPPDLRTLALLRVSSPLPGVGLFWAVVRIFALYALAPLYRLQLPACILLGDRAQDLASTIANTFDALRFTAPGRIDADAGFRKLAANAARHTWPPVISLPERGRDVGSRLLDALPDKQAFIAGPMGLQYSDLLAHRWWAIEVHEFEHAQGLIENLALPVLLHYLKDLKSRQGNYHDWSEDWKICAWKDLGIWFGRISRSREARNQCEKLIHFGPG